VLFSRDNPSKIIKRSNKPVLSSKRNWGNFFGGISNHIVPEGLVVEKNRWLLYYGAADKATQHALWEV